mgnify:CR=1 FL=1
MHIDLNSCFATIEQQAHPAFRNKPLVMAAYTTPSGCVIAPSIEAKKLGIKLGMTVRDAKSICHNVIVRTTDTVLVRDVHIKFKKLFKEYSPKVTPKSIDEAVIDFAGTSYMKSENGLVQAALEIKQRMKDEIGDWLKCSIGISTSSFLAKTGAGLHKPDGLTVITHDNLEEIYGQMELIDICGINVKLRARLNAYNIYTPLDFLKADIDDLQKRVFKSINGFHWYFRLRGWEMDDVVLKRKSFGQNYSLPKPVKDIKELSRIVMKMCEKMGRRLRHNGFSAQGVHVACIYNDWTHWHRGRKFHMPLFTTNELFTKTILILNEQPDKKPITKFSVSCFDLIAGETPQLSLFDTQIDKKRELSKAMDKINDRYGEYIVTPALMIGMGGEIVDRISFGGVRELESLYDMG